LVVVQHDQAIGLHHGTQHTRALVAGGAHLQTALCVARHETALVLGAARFLAQRFAAVGLQQRWLRIGTAHEPQQSRSDKREESDHHRHRVARESEQDGRFSVFCDPAHRHGAARAHRDAPEHHVAELLHHGFGVVGLAPKTLSCLWNTRSRHGASAA